MPRPLGGNKLQTGESAPATAQKLLARRGTHEMLPFFRDLHQGRTFEASSATYEIVYVFLDDLKRIIGEGQRKG